MKIILTQEVDNLGEAGDVVTVKNGYARNYLIPQGLARLATKGAMKAIEEENRQAAHKRLQQKENAEELAQRLGKMELTVPAKVGEEERIFGTVTAQQVALALATNGIMVDRRKVELNEEIRVLGVYSASVKLHPEVTAQVKVHVVPESPGADL